MHVHLCVKIYCQNKNSLRHIRLFGDIKTQSTNHQLQKQLKKQKKNSLMICATMAKKLTSIEDVIDLTEYVPKNRNNKLDKLQMVPG